jgi:alpha-mannosidase
VPHKVTIAEDTPHRVSVTIETKISEVSWAATTISLAAVVNNESSSIEIDTQVEWCETMKFLKVEFPVNITNTSASYETQFGLIKRPTHYNTSWDMAKFEVCSHKWADLSEANYGVSILNDSKYGFATAGNVMRLSLLRAPKAPDGHADMGRHGMRYAIFPHVGALGSETVKRAFEFNHPLKIVGVASARGMGEGVRVGEGKGLDMAVTSPALLSAFRIHNAPHLILDTIKRGEDDVDVAHPDNHITTISSSNDDHSVILRLYDSLGGQTINALVTWGMLPVKKVYKVNALEDVLEDLSGKMTSTWVDGEEDRKGDGNGVAVNVRAFEVVTLKLVF